MQEDIEQKSIAFVVNNGKCTGRMLERLALHYLRKASKLEEDVKREIKNPSPKQGKQSVKRLGKQGQGLTTIEITDKNIKSFERHARKHGVDFALKKDKSTEPPRYIVFFKGRDEESIKSALKDYTQAMAKKSEIPSVKAKLRETKDIVKKQVIKVQIHKEINKAFKKGVQSR